MDRIAALAELEAHPYWSLRACAETDELGEPAYKTDLFFTPGAVNVDAAKAVCQGCPVMLACRQYALVWENEGVWGGLSADERRAERRGQRKRRARLAQQAGARPKPVTNWKPSPAQATLLKILTKQPDLRAAAVEMDRPFPNVQWVYSQMCKQLGFHQDELSVPEVIAQANSHLRAASCASTPVPLKDAA
ncbi:WhiB family transcriptional regulator [Streptomyces sp. NPDC052535]|uniref:WhiB family transcriptional regulator n=1 Tax=Streptomyces sp. NPDC052535 TaxID=3155531 RepID=UPI00341F81A5